MATIKPEVKTILQKFGLEPREALWDCHGTWVLLHKSCQTIAMKMGIEFDKPEILHMDIGKKEVVFLLKGHTDSDYRWDIGEAMPSNNKNCYPVSMALKRAEDKIIINLAKLREHGVYSSEEADDFKDKPVNGDQRGFADRIGVLISEATNIQQVRQIVKGHQDDLRNLPTRIRNGIKQAHDTKITELKENEHVS